jgi:hypothetical protein
MLRSLTTQLHRQVSHRCSTKTSILSSTKTSICFDSKRTLFTQDFLGVSVFLQKKEVALNELSAKNVDLSTLRKDVCRSFGFLQVDKKDDAKDVDKKADTKDVVKSEETSKTILISDDVRKMIYTSKSHKVKKGCNCKIKWTCNCKMK